eukprot:825660-Rhodomonas_salina.1
MENGAHPLTLPAHDQLIAQARQAMNELAGTHIPPMQHSIEDNSVVAAQHQGNLHQDGSISAVLPLIGDVAGQVLPISLCKESVILTDLANALPAYCSMIGSAVSPSTCQILIPESWS